MSKPKKPAQATAKKGSQVITKVGGTKGFSLVLDTIGVPTRGASLRTRAKWAVGYLQRFILHGETGTMRLFKLALKWLEEAAEAL